MVIYNQGGVVLTGSKDEYLEFVKRAALKDELEKIALGSDYYARSGKNLIYGQMETSPRPEFREAKELGVDARGRKTYIKEHIISPGSPQYKRGLASLRKRDRKRLLKAHK